MGKHGGNAILATARREFQRTARDLDRELKKTQSHHAYSEKLTEAELRGMFPLLVEKMGKAARAEGRYMQAKARAVLKRKSADVAAGSVAIAPVRDERMGHPRDIFAKEAFD